MLYSYRGTLSQQHHMNFGLSRHVVFTVPVLPRYGDFNGEMYGHV